VAETAAARHARTSVVTVSVDDLFFLQPSKVGTRVVMKGAVNRVFNRSMEVGVRVEGHHLSGEIVIISRAYFTMVAVENPSPTLSSPLEEAPSQSPPVEKPSSKGSFFLKKSKSGETKGSPVALAQQQAAQNLPRTASRLGPLRSVPLNTPDQIRRHEEALGRRRVRLERLQIKRSNHLAWPFTPDTNPRAFALENLRSLEKVALESENAQRLGADDGPASDSVVPKSPTLNRGMWEPVAESDDVKMWSRTTQHHGVSMKSECTAQCSFDALVFAVWDVGSRAKWDKAVMSLEIRERFDHIDSDIVWLAVDMRAINPTSKPTDFALLRSWRREGDSFVIASHSVVHHSVPASSNYVRAETATSGFILRKLGKGLVEIQYVVQLNQSGTSIVAGDLVGSSKVYAMRMQGLVAYAKSLDPDVYAGMKILQATSPSLPASPLTLGAGTQEDPSRSQCTLM
jgi:acyl-CoA hydrolase